MAEQTEAKIGPPSIDSSLARRDYHWIEITPEEFGEMLAEKLKSMNPKAWMLDVYCSNDTVFRNLVVKWRSGTLIKILALRFNREKGTTLDVRTED